MVKLLAFVIAFVARKHISTMVQDNRQIYILQHTELASRHALQRHRCPSGFGYHRFCNASQHYLSPSVPDSERACHAQTSRKEITPSNISSKASKAMQTLSRWPLMLSPGRSLWDLSTRSSKSTSTSRIATLSLVRIALGRDSSICQSTCYQNADVFRQIVGPKDDGHGHGLLGDITVVKDYINDEDGQMSCIENNEAELREFESDKPKLVVCPLGLKFGAIGKGWEGAPAITCETWCPHISRKMNTISFVLLHECTH